MLRLTVKSQTPEEMVLQVDGWVSEAETDVLEKEGTRLLQESELLVLDLKGLRFIDEAGIEILKQWSRGRLVLRGASPFLHKLLEEYGLM